MTGLCVVPRCNRGQPREAGTDRYACPDCVTALRRTLRGIEVYAAILQIVTTPLQGRGERRAPGFGSRPPTNLDRIIALDYRSRTGGEGPDDDDHPPRSILGTLNGLAEFVRAESQHPTRRDPTITTETGYLIASMEWCAHQPWIDDIADDLRALHRQVRRLAGDQPPNSFANCPNLLPDGECGHPLYMPARGDTITCGACDRPWTRPEWEHLAAILTSGRRTA